MSRTNTGSLIARTLKGYGVDHVFFMDAILRRSLAEMEQVGIRRILAHSEKAAAYMADGYCRIARRPGVCMAQSVGASNLAAGLQDPFFAGSGVIAITGRQVAENQYRNAYQEIPHQPMFSEVSKFSARAESPSQLAHLLRQAFREATTGDIRPVHLDVAGNTGSVTDMADTDVEFPVEPDFATIPAFRTRADRALMARAATAIEGAKSPLIVAGIRAVTSNAGPAIRKLAERQDIPVAGALDAKDLLVSSDSLNAGIVGTYSSEYSNRLMAEADLVIFIGSDAGDQVTNNFTLPSRDAKVIHIDANPAELGRNLPGTIGLAGDPLAVSTELLDLVEKASRPDWLKRLHVLAAEWRESVAKELNSDARPIRPERLCRELSSWLPEDAIVVADTGYSSQWTGAFLDLKHERQRYIRAAGSLGWAFPASLGAKCASPESPVVCFTGDGGFMYHLPELETAKRWGLNTVTIVNNNSRLAQGQQNIRKAYEGRPNERMREIYTYDDTDFARIAEAFGCKGIRVTDPARMRAALEEASSQSAPVVIDVVSDPEALAPLPWAPV